MFPNYCFYCLNNNVILLSLTNQSSHADGKTLFDYLTTVFGFNAMKHKATDCICIRCSKALQVAYHFIQMVMQTKVKIEIVDELQQENLCLENGMSQNNEDMEIMQPVTEYEIKENDEVNAASKNISPYNSSKILTQELNQSASTSNTGSAVVKGNFECTLCKVCFEDKSSLNEHNKQHKEIVPFKCKLCSFYTCYTESLSKHYKIIHKQNNVALDFYETNSAPKQVSQNPTFEIIYFCLHCKFNSIDQTVVDEHLMEKHCIEEDKYLYIKTLFKCPLCYRCFNALKYAKIHYTRYHNSSSRSTNTIVKKQIVCDKCGRLFGLKSSLLLHKRICEPPNAVNCNFCKLLFSSVSKYERHLQSKHAVSIKHECEICGKAFKCGEYLTIHRKRHNERYYQCDLCNKNYISNAELKVHKQRIHNKHLKFKCNVCGKLFADISLLKNHENKEHSERYFKCMQCDYKSYSNFAVRVHQYQHTGKPYKCPACSKAFVLRKDLTQHAAKHHSLNITNEEMAQMFRISQGYTSRFDAFSQQNNNLEITELKELELEAELKEFGVSLKDIMEDLFDNKMGNELP